MGKAVSFLDPPAQRGVFSIQKSRSQERLHNIGKPNKRDSIRSKIFAGGGVGFGKGRRELSLESPSPPLFPQKLRLVGRLRNGSTVV